MKREGRAQLDPLTSRIAAVRIVGEETNEGPDMVSGKGVDWVKVKDIPSFPQTFNVHRLSPGL